MVTSEGCNCKIRHRRLLRSGPWAIFFKNSALAEVSSENSLSDISSLSLAVIETVIINLEFISSVFVYVILEVGYNN